MEQDRILPYKVSSNKCLTEIRIALSFLRVDPFTRSILVKNTTYERMYIASRSYIASAVHFYFVKHNVQTEVIFFDDGEGSYFNDTIYKEKTIARIYYSILFGRKSVIHNERKILYSPELYNKVNHEEYVEKIPVLWNNPVLKSQINAIFNIHKGDIIRSPVIIFDTICDEEWKRSRLNKCYEMITDIMGDSNVLLKRHPRDKSAVSIKCNEYEGKNIPFEGIALNMDLDSSLLIAYSSTAVSTPKILFNKEPTIILLYKIVNPNVTINQKRDKFYSALKAIYSTGRVYTPRDIEELRVVLKNAKLSLINVLGGSKNA